MSKRVLLSKIRIWEYVKTCSFVENPDCWVCQNVFVCRKSGFVGMSKRVFLSKSGFLGNVCFFVENPDLWVVKTCLFVENPDLWVCQNVFC